MPRTREQLLGVLLFLVGVLALAGAAGELGSLMSLPELTAALAVTLQEHGETLRPAGYLLAGSGTLMAAICCLGNS